MRRLARILGVIGGIGAILWAMRDRLVSVAIPREPQPPGFRVPERTSGRPEQAPDSQAAVSPPARGLTEVTGIGPVYATRLEAAGVATLSELAEGDVQYVARAAEVSLGRAQGWIESARGLVES